MRRKTDAEKLDALNRQYKQKNKYIAANYDRIGIVTPKGTKDRIKALTGQTINNYINELIAEDLKRREAAEDPEHNLQESRPEGPEAKPQEAPQGTTPGARTNRHEATKSPTEGRTEAQEGTTSPAAAEGSLQEEPKPRRRSRKASGANRSPQETTGGPEEGTTAGSPENITAGSPETTEGPAKDIPRIEPVEAADTATKGSSPAADLTPGEDRLQQLFNPFGDIDIPPEELPFH